LSLLGHVHVEVGGCHGERSLQAEDLAGMESCCRCRVHTSFSFGTWKVSRFIRWPFQKW